MAESPYPFSFRKAVKEDGPAVVALVNSVYRGEEARQSWTTEADLIEGPRVDEGMFRGILAQPGHRLLLACDSRNDERSKTNPASIVGCVHLEDRGHECHLGMLSVKASHQKLGVGTRLMNHAEEIASRDMGAAVMTMHVINIREELIAWYLRRGYTRTGEITPFGGEAASLSRLKKGPLFFETLKKQLL